MPILFTRQSLRIDLDKLLVKANFEVGGRTVTRTKVGIEQTIVRLLGIVLSLLMTSTALGQASNVNVETTASRRESREANGATNVAPDADRLFREGREAQERGDCKLALKLFLASHRLKLGRGKLINIAVCEKELGRWADALRRFKAISPQIEPNDPRYAFVQQNIAELQAKVPYLRIVASSLPSNAVVLYDHSEIPRELLGEPMPVNPGSHVIMVEAEGREDKKYETVLTDGQRLTLEVAPGRLILSPVEVREPAIYRSDTASNTHNRVAIAIGFVGVGVAAIFGSIALVNHLSATDTQTKGFLLAGTVSFGVGIAGFAIAPAFPAPKQSKVSAGVVLSPDWSGVLIRGAF